jgi:transcriptional regulator with XRE-family HTH domain
MYGPVLWRTGVFVPKGNGLGKRIQAAREARGLSIEQCAYAIDPSCQNHWYATWLFWEESDGYCLVEYAEMWPAIEALLGVSIQYLAHSRAQNAVAKKLVETRLRQYEPDAEIVFDRYDQESGISERIKQTREWRQLTPTEAAAKLGLTERDWLRYENGGWPIDGEGLLALGQSLDVNLNWLLCGKESSAFEIPPELTDA